jgi:glycosyltransferase involved in cell wall biosynthesis
MRVSICICTLNRSSLLDKTIDSLSRLDIPRGVSLEIIVVDNNSTDNTQAVLHEWAKCVELTVLREPIAGLTFARNRALEHALGELIVWTDDDVVVHPQWLSAYVRAAEQWPGAAYFGGTIDPAYEAPPPKWVVDNINRLQGMLVIRQLGDETRLLHAEEYPFGANMAFRRCAATANVTFDTAIGNKGGRMFGGDDLGFIKAVQAAGGYGVWVGDAAVRHFVPTSRMTLEFLIKWNEDGGVGQARRTFGSDNTVEVFGVPRWLVRRAMESYLELMLARVRGKSSWVLPFARSRYYGAYLKEWRALKVQSARGGRMGYAANLPITGK